MKLYIKIFAFLILVYFWLIIGFCHASIHPYMSAGMGRSGETRNVLASPSEIALVGVESRHFGASMGIMNITQVNNTETLNKGEISVTPLMFSGYVRVPLTRRSRLNMGGGASYVMASHSIDSSVIQSMSSFGYKIRDDIKDGLGAHAMGGMEYSVSKHFSIGADVTYLFYDTTVDTVLIDTKVMRKNETHSVRPLNLDTAFVFMVAKVIF
jgi:opacity protein-like surface antigen